MPVQETLTSRQQHKIQRAVPSRPPSVVDKMRWERRDAKDREMAVASQLASVQSEVRSQKLSRGEFQFSSTRPIELAQLETSPLPAARGFAPVVIKGIPPSNAELQPRRVRTRPLPKTTRPDDQTRWGLQGGTEPSGGTEGHAEDHWIAPSGPLPWSASGLPPIHVHISLPSNAMETAQEFRSERRKQSSHKPRMAALVSAAPISIAAVEPPVVPAACGTPKAMQLHTNTAPSQRQRHTSVMVGVPIVPRSPTFTSGDSLRSAEDRPGGET